MRIWDANTRAVETAAGEAQSPPSRTRSHGTVPRPGVPAGGLGAVAAAVSTARFAAVAIIIAGCGRTTSPIGSGAFEADANQVTIGMKMKMTEEGTTKADIFADTAVTMPGQTRTNLKGVRLLFSTPSGQQGTLTSRSGEYDPASQVMVRRGASSSSSPASRGRGRAPSRARSSTGTSAATACGAKRRPACWKTGRRCTLRASARQPVHERPGHQRPDRLRAGG
jgi:hypothetical protein